MRQTVACLRWHAKHLVGCSGLCNHYPDIDALGQPKDAGLLRRGMNFSGTGFPLGLPRGAFSSVNSRSTIFLQDALWALVLPRSVSPYLADVWRGFWSQRLVWEIGGRLAFSGVTGNCKGVWGSSSMEQSAGKGWHIEEGARLIAFLLEWKVKESSLPEAMVALASAMAQKNFWTGEDVGLIEAWIEVSTDGDYSCSPAWATCAIAMDGVCLATLA
jgi:hypothetical protein